MLPTPGWMRLPLNRERGLPPLFARDLRAGWLNLPLPNGRDCDSWMLLIELVHAVTGRWRLQCFLRPHSNFIELKRSSGDTDTDTGRKCPDVLTMGVQVINPAQGVPATVQPVTSCRLLRTLRDVRGARENWRTRARVAQAASLAG